MRQLSWGATSKPTPARHLFQQATPEESPASLKEMGSRAQAVRGASLSIQRSVRRGLHLRLLPNSLCTSPLWIPLQVVGALGDGLSSLNWAWPSRVPEQPGHQALSDESRP
ncbi:hypothetical protein CRENBAI_010866 [Crenichthys baileyi]|uniref:Uncharacterized protein n=1 Tax=Crenichthys baileyi TaxID=28760 RepID=A0AAV9QXM1_9TELE